MRTNDGLILRADRKNPVAIVAELRATSHEPGTSAYEYRRMAAGRAGAQAGRRVRYATDEEFVEDLLALGFLIDE